VLFSLIYLSQLNIDNNRKFELYEIYIYNQIHCIILSILKVWEKILKTKYNFVEADINIFSVVNISMFNLPVYLPAAARMQAPLDQVQTPLHHAAPFPSGHSAHVAAM